MFANRMRQDADSDFIARELNVLRNAARSTPLNLVIL